MKDILKRINVVYYISILIFIAFPIIVYFRTKGIELDTTYVRLLTTMYVLAFIVITSGVIEDIRNNKNLKTIVGIPSGDYEVEVFDCTAESFKNYVNKEPNEASESCFYKDLYMVYRIPITEQMRKMSEDGSLLKIKLSDKGVQSVKKLKQKAINLTPDEIKY